MSGFTSEILIKTVFSEGQSIALLSEFFSECLSAFFHDEKPVPEIEMIHECYSIFFFINENEENEKLISFILKGEMLKDDDNFYLSITDNSSDTEEIFNSCFFDFVISFLQNEIKVIEAYLVVDPAYVLISDVFNKKKLEFKERFSSN